MNHSVSYRKSPIKEAVYDIKFMFDGEIDMSIFEELYKNLATEYPKKEILNQQFVSFKFGETSEKNQFTSNQGIFGVRLTSIDGLHIVQFRPDGITFSRMEPYSGWDTFSTEAERLVAAYIELLNPKYISRLALRFVNSITIPETTFEIKDYFKTEPKLADEIKADMRNFFMRQFIQNENAEIFAIINQTTADLDADKQGTGVVFDIDVFKENINIQFKSEEYKLLLSKIRDFRSDIFEKSITDKTRDLFK